MYLNLNTHFLTRNRIRRTDQLQTESFFLVLEKDGKRRKLSNYEKRTRPWVRVCKVTFLMPYQHLSTSSHPLIGLHSEKKNCGMMFDCLWEQMCMCCMFLWICFVFAYFIYFRSFFPLSLWKEKKWKKKKLLF